MSRSTLARDVTLAAAPAMLVATLLLARGLIDGPTLDGSVFALIGDGLLHGRTPYLDLWDHKPPGVYLVNAGAGVILPFADAWTRAWLASWLSTVTALWLIAWLVRREGIQRRAIALSLLGAVPLVGAFHFVLGGGQTESVGLGFVMVTVAILVVARSPLWFVIAGLAMSGALLVSLQFAPAALAMGVVLALRRSPVAVWLAFIAGLAVPVLLVLGWLAAAGALPDAIDQVWGYNRAYLANNQQYRGHGLRVLAIAAAFVLPVVVAAVVRVVRAGRGSLTEIELMGGVWLASWVVYVLVQGLVFDHYVTAVAPPLVILGAAGLARLGGLDRQRSGDRRRFVAVAALTIGFPLVGLGLTEGRARPPEGLAVVVEEVSAQTASTDTIFVWGNEPRIYLETRRWPAARYSYMFPLTTPGYGSAQMSADVVNMWERAPPSLIIDATTNPGRVGGWPIEATSKDPEREDAVLDPLRAFVEANYAEVGTAGTWTLLAPIEATR